MKVIYNLPGEKFQKRLSNTGKILIVLFAILTARLWYLQTIHGPKYSALSQKNSIRLMGLRSSRGEITGRNGIVMAANQPGFNVMVFRSKRNANNAQFNKLFASLGMNKKLSDFPMKRFSVVKKNAKWEEVCRIEEKKSELPGLGIEIQPKRYYPGGQTAAHILGYVGEISGKEMKNMPAENYHTGDIIGKFGIERSSEQWLRGIDGGKQVLVNAKGHQIETLGCKEPVPGSNISLTIDYKIQKIVEEAIGNKRGSIVVMDPRNGKILGMTSRPAFDLNIFTRPISIEKWKKLNTGKHSVFTNRAIQGEYPPASTFKVVPAIAALEEELIEPGSTFTCPGSYQVGNRTFRCWKRSGHGALNITEGIINSCDVFFYQLGRRVGPEKMALYAKKLGLNDPTGIDIPGEKRGLIPDPNWKKTKLGTSWYPGDTANMSIGQGYVLTTPIQMANVFCTIANGGTLYKPYMVKSILAADGKLIKEISPHIIRELHFKPQTRKILIDALSSVVSRGTGYKAKVKGIKVAGKTGTAENPHGADHAWFIGFAPVDEPEICVCVMLENAGHGSSAAAPLCGRIIKEALKPKGK